MSLSTALKSRLQQYCLVHLCCDLETDWVLSDATGHKVARFMGQKRRNAVAFIERIFSFSHHTSRKGFLAQLYESISHRKCERINETQHQMIQHRMNWKLIAVYWKYCLQEQSVSFLPAQKRRRCLGLWPELQTGQLGSNWASFTLLDSSGEQETPGLVSRVIIDLWLNNAEVLLSKQKSRRNAINWSLLRENINTKMEKPKETY